jgi:hypothetical protein
VFCNDGKQMHDTFLYAVPYRDTLLECYSRGSLRTMFTVSSCTRLGSDRSSKSGVARPDKPSQSRPCFQWLTRYIRKEDPPYTFLLLFSNVLKIEPLVHC